MSEQSFMSYTMLHIFRGNCQYFNEIVFMQVFS
ncbi:hypothetical protein T4D_11222 [Trichinella pseudospiralis]|uniref:Uncharacterized protein n=1 Tax=Trichinella pseudospiralis TaxID=6337 RepID=A0A0V1CSB5_TRIPS|nr:hypothetical protein T4D_11222 [Trichinella pseudospiralis]